MKEVVSVTQLKAESEVVDEIKSDNCSQGVEMAVLIKDLVYVKCECK